MRAAHTQQVEALQARCEQSESERDSAQRDLRGVKQRAADAEQQLGEERKRYETALQSLHDRWRADSAAQHDERLSLTRSIKEAEASAALRKQQLDALRERLAEEKPNVEAERARAALERVDEEAKRLRSEVFETRRTVEDQRAEVRSLEERLREQERKFEMAKMQLRMDFEVQLAKERASMHGSGVKRSVGSMLGGNMTSFGRNSSATGSRDKSQDGVTDTALPTAKRSRL
jgi:chromosome segregation ATPase